ncbi:MAG: hypothetical protein IPL03_12655 [Sterolibacteriaceae bacterium]|nr:hypothetical protein [Candidatus Methylophosphatis haderslevensis]
MTHYGHQADRFYEGLSYDNLVHLDPNSLPSNDDPPFWILTPSTQQRRRH